MPGELDQLELLLKIRSEGQENLKAVTDLMAKMHGTVDATSQAMAQQNEVVRKLGASTEAAMASMVKAHNEGTVTKIERETDAIEKQIRALERQAAVAGKTGAAKTAAQSSSILSGYYGPGGAPEEQVNRVKNALAEIEKAGPAFQGNLARWFINPTYGATYALQDFARNLGAVPLVMVGTAVAAGVVGAAMFKLGSSAAQAGLELTNFATRTGVSIQYAQQLEGAGRVAGVSVQGLTASMRSLSQGLADGGLQSKRYVEFLSAMQVQTRDVNTGALLPMDKILQQMFDRMRSGKDNFANMTAEGKELGRSFKEFLPMIERMPELLKMASSSAGFSDGTTAALTHAAEKINLMELAWERFTRSLGADIALSPTFTKLVEFATKMFDAGNRGASGTGSGRDRGVAGAAEGAGLGAVAGTIIGGVIGAIGGPPGILAGMSGGAALGAGVGGVGGYLRNNSNDPAIGSHASTGANGLGPDLNAILGFSGSSNKAFMGRINGALSGDDQLDDRIRTAKEKMENLRADVLTIKNNNENSNPLAEGKLKEFNSAKGTLAGLEQEKRVREVLLQQQKELDALQQKEEYGLEKINSLYKEQMGELTGRKNDRADAIAGIEAQRQQRIANFNTELAHSNEEATTKRQESAERGAASVARARAALTAVESLGNRTLTPREQIEQAYQDDLGGIATARTDNLGAASILRKKALAEKNPLLRSEEPANTAAQAAEDTAEEATYNAKRKRQQELTALEKREAAEQIAQAKQLAAIQIQGVETQISQQSRLAHVRAEMAGGPGRDEVTVARATYRARIDLAERLNQKEVEYATKNLSAEEQKNELARIGLNLVKEKGDAEIEYEERIGKLVEERQRQQRDAAKTLASAVLSESNAGDAMRKMVLAQVRGLGTQVLTNILTPVMKHVNDATGKAVGGQRDASGNPTLLGRLLENTPFATSSVEDAKKKVLAGVANGTAAITPMVTAQNTTNSLLTQIVANTGGSAGAVAGVGSVAANTSAQAALSGGSPGSENAPWSESNGVGGNSVNVTGMMSPVAMAASPMFQGSLAKAASSTAGLAGFLSGAAGVFGGSGAAALSQIFTPAGKGAVDVNGNAIQHMSGAQLTGALVGTGAVIAGGAMTAIQQFSRGGAKGALGGVSAIAGTAAAIDPEPISKAVLGAVAMTTQIISGFLPDPRAARQRALNVELQAAHYNQPASYNVVMDSASGNSINIGPKGNLTVTGTKPQLQGYNQAIGFQANYPLNLLTASQYRVAQTAGNGASQPHVVINVSTMDAHSFNQNAHLVAGAMKIALQAGHPVRAEISRAVNPR